MAIPELSQNTEFLECPLGPQTNCGRAKQSKFLISLPLLIIINTTLPIPLEVSEGSLLTYKGNERKSSIFLFTTCARFSTKPTPNGGWGETKQQQQRDTICYGEGRGYGVVESLLEEVHCCGYALSTYSLLLFSVLSHCFLCVLNVIS